MTARAALEASLDYMEWALYASDQDSRMGKAGIFLVSSADLSLH